MKRILSILMLMSIILLLGCRESNDPEVQSGSVPTQEPIVSELPRTEEGAVEEDVITVPVTELIVSSQQDMPDLDSLSKMTSLTLLDLTALPYTPFSEIEAISLALPDCRIIWNQMLTDGIFRSDATELTLPNASAEDINLLNAFSDLRFVDATGSREYAALRQFCDTHPTIDVRYAYQKDGFTLSVDDQSIVLPAGIDAAEFTDVVCYFPNLRNVDLRQSEWTDEQTDAFCSANPVLTVARSVSIDNLIFDSDTTVLNLHDLSGWSVDRLISKLRSFANLEAIGLPSEWSESDCDSFSQAFPNVHVAAKISLFGKTIDCSSEEIDLTGTKIGSSAEVEDLITQAPFMKKLVLMNCGLKSEDIAALADQHPDIRFVWVIQIGPHKLRTDAVGFSTKNPSKYTSPKASEAYNKKVKNTKRLYEGDIALLKYCSDLEALDLGHNYLTNKDLEVIAGLTKLKVLILADNKITDISALTTLKNLEYIELFMNKIPDLTPLTEMPVLQDVNVCNVGASDLTPLFSLQNVKRLWYAMNPFSREQAIELKDSLPNCLCNYTTRDETAEGWREDPRYTWMRSYFD